MVDVERLATRVADLEAQMKQILGGKSQPVSNQPGVPASKIAQSETRRIG
jgi:hypothetical protein